MKVHTSCMLLMDRSSFDGTGMYEYPNVSLTRNSLFRQETVQENGYHLLSSIRSWITGAMQMANIHVADGLTTL